MRITFEFEIGFGARITRKKDQQQMEQQIEQQMLSNYNNKSVVPLHNTNRGDKQPVICKLEKQ